MKSKQILVGAAGCLILTDLRTHAGACGWDFCPVFSDAACQCCRAPSAFLLPHLRPLRRMCFAECSPNFPRLPKISCLRQLAASEIRGKVMWASAVFGEHGRCAMRDTSLLPS